MKTKSYLLPICCFAMVAVAAACANACPNCQETIATDPAQQNLAKGIYYSILFMMSMPFLIFGGLCSYFYYLVRCDQTNKTAETHPQLEPNA